MTPEQRQNIFQALLDMIQSFPIPPPHHHAKKIKKKRKEKYRAKNVVQGQRDSTVVKELVLNAVTQVRYIMAYDPLLLCHMVPSPHVLS